MKKVIFKQIICAVLCLAMLLGFNIGLMPEAFADGIDVGANPTPKVDIAVNVPADYPGTFLDFKQELTEKLIEQGMSPSDFRITTTAVTIDTTDTSSWIVYDHYRNSTAYNSLVTTADQKALQPYRASDSISGTAYSMADAVKNNRFASSCLNVDRHIYSYQDAEGKASMVFAGYPKSAFSDFMIYPAASNARRNFSFDINPAVINTHTLSNYGFFLNAGLNSNGTVSGYALIFDASSHSGSIQYLNGVSTSGNITGSAVSGSNVSLGITAGGKARLTVELNKDSVTIQVQQYVGGNLTEPTTPVRNLALNNTGFNGFGPLVNYKSHNCSALSMMKYSDLEMSYEASAFDALKNVQYYEGANQKYFINLTGTNNNPGIPEEFNAKGEVNQNYRDGINRMNEKEIFYISNTDDGQIVTDSIRSEGKVNHQGLGSGNGFYASGDAYVELIAQYIAQNHRDGVKFIPETVESQLPLANFYIKDARTENEQMMTIHLQHLVNSKESVPVNIVDKSKIGTLSGEDGKLSKWVLTVTDPDNKVVSTQTVTDPSQFNDYVFTKDSKVGRYTMTLVVTDNKGNESKDFSTYITAFLDNEFPNITGKNTSRDTATITLTDTGEGIDEDGITFLSDGRGSGVAAYWVTNDENAKPTEDDWIELPFAQHSFDFNVTVDSLDPVVVWVRDECDNVGSKAVFQPTLVRVEDPDGKPIDEYYVIGEKPIVVLPPDEDVPEPDDPDNEFFSGWTTPGGVPVTPGTTPDPVDNVIIVRPSYSRDYAKMIYLANGGKIATAQGQLDSSEYQVVSGASILGKVEAQDVQVQREGYTFQGWKLLKSGDAANAANNGYINTAGNLETIGTQLATVEKNAKDEEGKDVITRDTYYLVAQWKEGEYTLRLNPNGGSAGNVKSIEGIKFGTSLSTLKIPADGRGIPSRPGYFFRGWSVDSGNSVDKIFKLATGYSHATVEVPTMPARDMTVYAVWQQDTSKYIVSFDSNGGSTINDQAYTATATKYDTFMKPSRTGYTFEGWFQKNDDGSMGTTEYKGGENLIVKANHSFVAKWAPKNDTKYTVDYYINSGEVDKNGEFIYTKVPGVSKTYSDTTETQVQVKEADKLSTIEVDGVQYWFNADSANNVLEGKVSGSPALSLKLCYDRYFTVNASTNGNGTAEVVKKDEGTVAMDEAGTLATKESFPATVKWAPKEGYYVSRVVVDGAVRDDLLNVTEYTFPTGFHENHRIYVAFTSNDTPREPVNPGPVAPQDRYYTVSTIVVGCSDQSKYSITPSTSAKAGSDVHIDWSVNDSQYFVSKVEIDGLEESAAYTSFDFSQISADHNVKITLSTLPTIGGSAVENAYTVTVNRYGGDDKVTVSDSQVVKEGESAAASWNVNDSEYRVLKVMVDGKAINLRNDIQGVRNFSNVTENHVVDVYFAKPQQKVPDFNNDQEFIQVTTQLVGAPGNITGGAVIEKGNDYDVDWDVTTTGGNPDDDSYFFYEIEKVEVNGTAQEVAEDNNVALTQINEDTDVKVYVKPVLENVTILKYGEGEVSPSKTVFYGANYNNLSATPEEGWTTVKIVVDGVVMYDYFEANKALLEAEAAAEAQKAAEKAAAEEAAKAAEEAAKAAEEAAKAAEEAQKATEENTENTENTLPAEGTENTLPAESTENTNPETGSENSTSESGENATTDSTETTTPEAGTETTTPAEGTETTTPAEGTETEGGVQTVAMRGRRILRLKTLAFEPETTETPATIVNAPALMTAVGDKTTNITDNHVIEVYFTKDDEKTEDDGTTTNKPTPVPANAVLHKVGVDIVGGPGVVQDGLKIVNDGESTTVNWKLTDPANYEIASVTNNGAPVDYAPTGEQDTYAFTISDITADQNVVITLRQKNSDKHEKVLEPTITRTTYNVTTAIKGKGGSISNGGSVVPGSSETVKWTLEEGAEVRYVFVNGQLRPDLVQAGQVTLSEISQDQSVVVYLATPGASSPVNVDKDGDGTPDINIDKDNDGLPDVDVDTDDDGEPDVNIDTDGDGEPDVNIDTDGDLVPDANIDTNGDLIPDVNIINRGSHVISDPNIVTIGAVQTGDVDLSLMILVMLASAMGLAVVLRKRLGMSK